jgi:lipoic acid synthetase
MEALDPDEPQRVAMAVKDMGLRYVVITSVTRDDLSDGGAGHFAAVIKAVRDQVPHALIEVLIPDFQGDPDALYAVLDAGPDVLNHNIETVPRLYPVARPQVIYEQSLELIKRAAAYNASIPGKSGLMVGLGETDAEIQTTMQDLLAAKCRILTIGQYLQPSKAHLPVKRFVPPEAFEQLRETALEMGFAEVASGPFVRSSYQAKDLYEAVKD